MKNITESRTALIFAFIFSLPILLFVFNPSLQLGGTGLLLGFIGTTISPLIIFGLLLYLIIKAKN
ncbi:MAG: hypothetical protein ACI83O_000427 [Patescibacteria group bacterium]|jgi:hypothetical protein